MKRYQVFISSTYTDLKEERSAVLKSVLKLRLIPVGMEQFVASNEEQFSYIKKLLEDTDYYIVIVGNRYGSIADDGLSYTEKEFDYAVSLGIPVIACVHSNPNAFSVDKSDTDQKLKEKLQKFREKIMENRLVSYINWTQPAELATEITAALHLMIYDCPRPGWERVGKYDNTDLLSQINELRIENQKLKTRIQEMDALEQAQKKAYVIPWDKTRVIKGYLYGEENIDTGISTELNWKQIFGVLGRILLLEDSASLVHYKLNEALFSKVEPSFHVKDTDFYSIIVNMARFGLIDVADERIILTQKGKNIVLSEEIEIDGLLESTHQQVFEIIKNLGGRKEKSNQKVLDLIKSLSNFNSNPESINYLGETLLGVKVFLTSKKEEWGAESVNEAQQVIEEILNKAFNNNDRLQEGIFDPVFDLSKVMWLIDYLNQKIE